MAAKWSLYTKSAIWNWLANNAFHKHFFFSEKIDFSLTVLQVHVKKKNTFGATEQKQE